MNIGIYDVLAQHPTRQAWRIAGWLLLSLVLRIAVVPAALAVLTISRAITALDAAITPRSAPPAPPPRWAAANTRTRAYANVA